MQTAIRPKAKSTTETKKRTAVLYARVSSKEQHEEGYSVPAQLRALREYALKKDLVVLAEFTEAETAKTAGRKAFGQMLRFAKEQGISCILVEKTDRLYRNFSDFVKVDELGVELHFVKENAVIGESSHSSERLMHSIKVCMAKNYVDNLSEEIKKGMLEKARQGVYPSHAPLGFLNAPDGHRKKIVPDPERASLVTKLFETYAEGKLSILQLTSLVKDWGLTTKKGHKVHKSSIAKMLTCPIYTGRIVWHDETYEGAHEALVDSATFRKVQDILSGRRNSHTGYGTVPIAYRGMIRCARCGGALTGEIKKGKYVYYHCYKTRNGCDLPYVKEECLTLDFAELLEELTISDEILSWLKQALRESSEDESKFRKEQHVRLDDQAERLRDRIAKLYEDKCSKEVSEATYRMLRDRYETELDEATAKLAAFDHARSDFYDEGEKLLELAANAHIRFKEADSDDRQELLSYLCSNCIYDGEKLSIVLNTPFDLMLKACRDERSESAPRDPKTGRAVEWWRQRGSNP